MSNLLGDETPHPVGSAANRAVKERLITRLTALGLRPEEQRTIGCAGDDGAAVAALLEVTRIKAVINLEGSGSSGPVYLLRTGPASGELMAAFRDVAPHPFAQSFAEENFKRMPNDTDFSVSLRAGLPGIDFAFAGERNHYHTPLDSIANLDLGTLQHHGESTLPLLRTLVDADLSAATPNEVYTNLGRRHWLHWSPVTGIVLAAITVALLLFATWRARVAPLRLLAAVAIGVATLIVAASVTLAALWLVDVRGTIPASAQRLMKLRGGTGPPSLSISQVAATRSGP